MATESYTVYAEPIQIVAANDNPKLLRNIRGADLHHSNEEPVSTKDKTLAEGDEISLEETTWVICANAEPATVQVATIDPPTNRELDQRLKAVEGKKTTKSPAAKKGPTRDEAKAERKTATKASKK